MGLGINYVIMANHLFSLITSLTTDPDHERILIYMNILFYYSVTYQYKTFYTSVHA